MKSSEIRSFLKERFGATLLLLVSVLPGLAGTLPIYINTAPLIAPPATAPQIDARAWVNQALFDVTSQFSFGLPIPFESQNTLSFTNAPLTLMNGDPGFRFFQNTNG